MWKFIKSTKLRNKYKLKQTYKYFFIWKFYEAMNNSLILTLIDRLDPKSPRKWCLPLIILLVVQGKRERRERKGCGKQVGSFSVWETLPRGMRRPNEVHQWIEKCEKSTYFRNISAFVLFKL